MNKPINKLVHVTEELPREKHNPLIKKLRYRCRIKITSLIQVSRAESTKNQGVRERRGVGNT